MSLVCTNIDSISSSPAIWKCPEISGFCRIARKLLSALPLDLKKKKDFGRTVKSVTFAENLKKQENIDPFSCVLEDKTKMRPVMISS